MKNIKIMFLFASITFFASIPLGVEAAERDCSDPQGFHEKMMCKLQEGKGISFGSSGEATGEKSSTLSNTLKKLKKTKSGDGEEGSKVLINDSLWQKIKTFGGKNVGEEG